MHANMNEHGSYTASSAAGPFAVNREPVSGRPGQTTANPCTSDLPAVSTDCRISTHVSPIADILRKLDILERLHEDWDSYGGAPPLPAAVQAARDLIYRALASPAGEKGLPFAVAPVSGGGIQLEWRAPACALEVEVGAHGGFGYLLARGEEPDRKFEERDDVPHGRILQLIHSVIS